MTDCDDGQIRCLQQIKVSSVTISCPVSVAVSSALFTPASCDSVVLYIQQPITHKAHTDSRAENFLSGLHKEW